MSILNRPCPYCKKDTPRSEDRCLHCLEPIPKEIQWWVYGIGLIVFLLIVYLVVDWELWLNTFNMINTNNPTQ